MGSMSANHLKSGLKGPNNIKFADGQFIRFKAPEYKLGGTVMGERTIEAIGSVVFEDVTNNYKAVIQFSTYKKSGFWKKSETGKKDEFTGIIYKSKRMADKKLNNIYKESPDEIKDIKSIKDMEEQICEIQGSWLRNLIIDNQKFWDIDEFTPYRQIPDLEEVLPSDWRYREDLIWLRYGHQAIAQAWKFRMEEQ